MAVEQNQFMERLVTMLDESGVMAIFPCIADLVVNGIQTSRFAPSNHLPSRLDVTQYLATWCRDAHLSENACRTWLCDYAVLTLSSLSKSSPSAIRHSTKSYVKYIYKSEHPFLCEQESNGFRAECSKTCRVYNEMVIKALKAKADAVVVMERRQAVPPPTIPTPTVKELHREDFLSAMQLVSHELSKGTKKADILILLKKQGKKTRTGREWTYGILDAEIQKLGQQENNRRQTSIK